MTLLQEHGIAAGAVLSGRECTEDPHLAARGHFVLLGREGYGPFPSAGLPIHFSATPATYRIVAPKLGEFNAAVLAELGVDAATQADLLARGVLCDAPPA
jgi:crotonobetainyl-CoA:carnitine CoA-transferase CaiB-like acyl-CoA transferase